MVYVCGVGFVCFGLLLFLDRISLYSSICPGTHYVNHADFKLTVIASTGKKGMHHHAHVWAFEISMPAHSDTSPTTFRAPKSGTLGFPSVAQVTGP